MELIVHVYLHDHEAAAPTLKTLADAVFQLTQRINHMATALENLTAAVTAEKTVEDSVVTLLTKLAADLKAAIAANDPAAIQAVADQITANTAALADAVTANTPAA